MGEVFGSDAYSPKEIAERVERVGVTKANLPVTSMVALGVLAGGFIGLGALFATLVFSDSTLSFAVARLLGGVVFSLGLILVVVAGAELFTGNNLLVMACVAGRISVAKLLRNFAVVYVANFAGAAVDASGVINDPVIALGLVMRFPHEEHGVKRLGLLGLMKENEIARPRGAEVA